MVSKRKRDKEGNEGKVQSPAQRLLDAEAGGAELAAALERSPAGSVLDADQLREYLASMRCRYEAPVKLLSEAKPVQVKGQQFDALMLINELQAGTGIQVTVPGFTGYLYSRAELADLTEEYAGRFEKQAAAHQQTGHPAFLFSGHPNLDRLGRTYYVREPVGFAAPGGRSRGTWKQFIDLSYWMDGDGPLGYIWPDKDYERAVLLESLDLIQGARLQQLRPAIVKLKIDLLRKLAQMLRSEESDVIAESVGVITDALHQEDLEFCQQIDRQFERGLISIPRGHPLPRYVAGGITDCLLFAGLCESEVRIGRWHKTREAMAGLTGSGAPHGLLVAALDARTNEGKQLSKALDVFEQFQAEECNYWNGVAQRISTLLAARLHTTVRFEVSVPSASEADFRANGQAVLNYMKLETKQTGRVPLPLGFDRSPCEDELSRLQREKVLVVDTSAKEVYCFDVALNCRGDQFTYILCWAQQAGQWVKNKTVAAELDDPEGGREPSKVVHEIRNLLGEAYGKFSGGKTQSTVEDEWDDINAFRNAVLPKGKNEAYTLGLSPDQVVIL